MKRLFVFSAICLILLNVVCFAQSDQIKDTESQTHGADSSSSSIVDTYSFPGFKVIQFTLPVLSIYSYLLVSDGEALLIDPVRDVSVYIETAKKEGVVIKGVYLTHSHADFVAGHMEVVNLLGCPIYQSHKSGVSYPIKAVDENSDVNIGKATLKFMDTPGHTPDGMCCAVYGADQKKSPEALFTGDVLFVGSVGRPDLLEGTISAAWLAAALYDSWTNKISKLPDSVVIFPAHGAGSLCGAHLGDEPKSTIGQERVSNPYLQYTKKFEFIAAVLQGLPEAPQYFKHNAKMNREGPPVVKVDSGLPSELKPTIELSQPDKYFLVDVRDAQSYAKAHIPNSVNIAARGRLETWVGTIVPWGAKLALVADEAELKESLHRLHRVGYSADVIKFDSWEKAGLPVTVGKLRTPKELYGLMQNGESPLIVDVRLPSEWMAMRIGAVLNLPLNKLASLSSQLDPDQPVMVVCNSAYRSSLAQGILEREGFKKAESLDGGSEAWIKAGLPVIEATKSGGSSPADVVPKKQVALPERMSAEELKRLIKDLPGTFTLVDIRPEEQFREKTLQGAIHGDPADVSTDPAYLVGVGPLILMDRDGTIAMAIGGILAQKTSRPIKVLYGGIESTQSHGRVTEAPESASAVKEQPKSKPLDTSTPRKQAPKKPVAGC
jgi:glyoxylase-like metal-dependent hydrolase (beta-lactamase superfamily II)/rhodanese-related sulfurtransferase